LKVASLQYQYNFPKNFDAYRDKISHIVRTQASQGTELLLFPEYAGVEMSAFASLEKIYDYQSAYIELFMTLALEHKLFICSGSHLIEERGKILNRSYLFSPSNRVSYQDKCMLTPSESADGYPLRGDALRVFETPWGKVAICICYDAEFPSLVKQCASAGAELILVPSYTSSMHGFYRVFTSCRARALENQCYVVQSAVVGQTDCEMAYGAAAICSPIDEPFPEDGILVLGEKNRIGDVSATLDFSVLQTVRERGQTYNYHDSKLLEAAKLPIELVDLR
jgi:predicted amidohydrolase